MKKVAINTISVIPIAILQEELTINQLKVFIAIASFNGIEEGCEIKMEAIAKRAGLWKSRSDGTVNINAACKATKELVEMGWVVRLSRGFGKPYVYKVLFPEDEGENIIEQRPEPKEPDVSMKDIQDIFNAWNEGKVIRHISMTDKLKRAIITSLSQYKKEDLIKAIQNYATVVHSQDYFFKYKWILHDFLKRGVDKFLDEAEPLENFKRDKGGIKKKPSVYDLYGKYDI